ncbi:unnamed protein product [Rotaria sordida]|uniref:Uncharacterized protein n=1 Tax=Rotaria sordida TaxID=392033 RepID=A0A815LL02_9BILA|nr:unnamed protein product [Rotaria sordida]CAF1442291.1 unnamed protein product [Rotaria sordida]CAF1627549.1 unnamed protein product [Rotaria sordida]
MERIVSSTRPQIVPFIQVSSPTYFRKINNIVWSLTLFVFLIGFYIGLIPFMCGLCLARLRNSIADEIALKTNNIELEESLVNINNDKDQFFHCFMNNTTFDELEILLKKQQYQLKQDQIFKNIRTILNCLSIINLIIAFVIWSGLKLIIFNSFITFLLLFGSICVVNQIHMIYFQLSVLITYTFVSFPSFYIIIIDMIELNQRQT